jgi:hypothetical protein
MKKFKVNSQARWYLFHTAKKLAGGNKMNGWKRFKSTYREMDAFYHDGLGIVLKKPAYIMEHRTPLFLRVPTIKLGDGWVVQPFAKKTNLKIAVNKIQKQLEPYLARGIFPDIHKGNVGWVNDKPLMFDW